MQFTTASLMAMTTASMGVNAMQEFVKKTQFRNYGPGNYATTQRSRNPSAKPCVCIEFSKGVQACAMWTMSGGLFQAIP